MAAKVLIVDDESLLRWAVRQQLQGAGYEVVEAGSAVEALKSFPPGVDLVLLDYNLPDSNGLEVLRAIRERCPHCQVIVMSAQIPPEIVMAVKRLGAYSVVEKPFQLDEISRLAAHALAVEKQAV